MKFFSLIAVCLLFLVQGAQAQEKVDLDKIIIVSSRLAQNDYKLSSDVSVITQDMIEASNASTVAQILSQQLGVHIYDNGTTKTSTIDIRGFGDTANRNVLVLLNDRKVNPVDISGPDLLQIPLDSVERIEIVRGFGTVLYGDNAVGGVVNIITKEGKGKLSGKINTKYGSYDSRGTSAEVSGSTKHVSYYAYSNYDDQHGYRQNSDVLSKDFQTRLSAKTFDWLKVGLDASWHQDEYGLPGGLNGAEIERLGRRGSRNPGDKAFTKDRAVQGTFDISPLNEELGHLVMDVSYRDRDTYADFQSQGIATKRGTNTTGVTGKYMFDKTIFDHEVNLVTGLDYYKADQNILGSGFSTDDITISKEDIGLYISSELEVWNHIFLTGGTRYQKAWYTFDQKNSPQSYRKQAPDKTASMVGLKFDYAKGSNLFANVQQSFRFLATDEWYDSFNGLNTNLKQQTGTQYEVGVKHNFDDKVTVHVTPYVTKLRNEIFLDPTAGVVFGVPYGANGNYDRTLRQGIELGQTTELLKFFSPIQNINKLNFSTSYTYQDAEFDGGAFDGQRIPMVAKNQANGVVTLGVFDRYNMSLIGTYVGPRYAINDTFNTTPELKAYFTLDSKLTYTFKAIEVFFAVNNLFDQKYYSVAVKSTNSTNKDFFPAAERNFGVGMSLKF
jgi:iron complex outermembrane receptor protein